ncbi:hydroquinone glucosyltransferase-like [Panicum virgatum]|uniref:Glycosyltransferase n=1 Tax=Panicum virgatum TaxID=38727 RepID=A0A8T0W3G1_PANVG|nr:hydroquinone glucosyltransferase-like [Panicum virgatum]KAG2640506.1 hypothetical protein PVAP13_2KG075900 [Panicum virgatum]
MTTKDGPPHVAMLATPGMGHLIPLAELAKRLAARHGATATLLTFASTASATQRAFLATLPPSVSHETLPPADLSDLPHDALVETRMSVEGTRSLPALATILAELKRTTRLVAFVTDLFGIDAFDAARDAGVGRRCLFFPGSLHALMLPPPPPPPPELVVSIPGEFRDLTEPVRLPGCVPIPGPDVLSPLQDRSSPAFGVMVHLAERFLDAHDILVNSFDAVEPEVATVIRQPKPGRPPVYPVGPLILKADSTSDASDTAPQPPRPASLEWLDRQPPKSVIFISFGSGGALPAEQMRGLTLGLEISEQRFLWVVRSPSDEGSLSSNYYDSETKKDPFAYLPEGFVERTKDMGLVVPSWAPQIEVLSHEATGGFLTHCGWNSTLESLVHGVPMVEWPLYAEQRLNAVMLSEGVGAAIRLPEMKEKETIAAAVRELMAGEAKGAAVRAKVAELKMAAAEGLREGGAATAALDGVVENWAGEN